MSSTSAATSPPPSTSPFASTAGKSIVGLRRPSVIGSAPPSATSGAPSDIGFIVQINLPFKERMTITIYADENMGSVFKVLCEKRRLDPKDHVFMMPKEGESKGADVPVSLSLPFKDLFVATPPPEISIVRAPRKMVLMPTSSRQTNMRSSHGEKNKFDGHDDTSAANESHSPSTNTLRRQISISLGLHRSKSSNGLTPDNANLKGSMSSLGSSNGHLASSNSATDVSALDSASIADDRSLSTGSPHHSPSDSLAALHTSMSIPDNLDQLGASLGTTLEGLDASMEKLNVDDVNLIRRGSTKMAKPKMVRPRSQSVAAKSPHGSESSLPSALEKATAEDIFVRILLSNNQHTLLKAREETVMEDILREVCSRKGFEFDNVALELADTKMPIEMDRMLGYYKMKDYAFRLVVSDTKAYTSMIVSEDDRDVMILTNVNGKLDMLAATPEKLVEKMTDVNRDDPWFVNVLLMGYRSVMTCQEFLGYLLERFNADMPLDPTETERVYYTSAIIVVRSKVLDVIYTWATDYWTDFSTQPHLLKAVNAFIEAVVRQLSGAHESIIASAAKVQAYLADKEVSENALARQQKSINRRSKILESQLFGIKEKIVAQQLCVVNQSILSKVSGVEYLSMVWNKLDEEQLWDQCPNLAEFIDRSNKECSWVVAELLEISDLPQRVKALARIIDIVKECFELNNFFSVFAMLAGLSSPPIARLKKTWAGLSNSSRKTYEDLEKYTDPSKNMGKYRELVSKCKPPLIPLLPIIIKDLTFMNDGNPVLVDGMVNFDKLRNMTEKVMDVVKTLQTPYPFAPDPAIVNYLKNPRHLPKERLSAMSEALEPREAVSS